MTATTQDAGSARRHGTVWGARAHDWARNEEAQLPTYEEGLRLLGLDAGKRVLEVGCGTGCFLRLAVDRGLGVVGLDASEALVALARRRVPEAELHVGDMQFLPFADESFDAVAGFNSFFFAADMVAALREARRVARPGAPVLLQVWGNPQHCDLTTMKRAAQSLLPPAPDVPEEPGLWEPGVLEGIARAAGLTPGVTSDISSPLVFADQESMLRGLLSPGLMVELIAVVGEDPLRRAFVEALEPYRGVDGSYTFVNEWHFLLTRA